MLKLSSKSIISICKKFIFSCFLQFSYLFSVLPGLLVISMVGYSREGSHKSPFDFSEFQPNGTSIIIENRHYGQGKINPELNQIKKPSPQGINSTTILMSNGSSTTCDAKFYDSGGASGEYTNNQNLTYTINPTTLGGKVNVKFNFFSVESCCDRMVIFDGPNVSSPQLASFTSLAAGQSFQASNSNSSGSLTFRFTSDGSVTGLGWDADVTCFIPPSCIGAPNPGNTVSSFDSICIGQSILLATQNQPLELGLSYQWQSGTSISGPWTDISGATGSSISRTINTIDNYFRCQVTCSGITSFSNPKYVKGKTCFNISNGSATTCDSKFYDSGGPTGNYLNNETLTFTINPSTIGGKVKIKFNFFSVETCCDRLTIYDGPNIASPQIASFSSIPGGQTYQASNINSSGSLTFRFTSDGSSVSTGWDADVTCFIPPSCSGTPNPGNSIASSDSICIGQSIQLSTQNQPLESGLSYQWQTGTSLTGPWTNISGATASSISRTINAVDNYFRCQVTCSGLTSFSTPKYVKGFNCINMANGSSSTCNSKFYDSGGASGDYLNNQNLTYTINPINSSSKIRVRFNSYAGEICCDRLIIYDGVNTLAPILANLTSIATGQVFEASSSNFSGALTFRFTSNSSIVAPGWDADVSCFVLPSCSGSPNPGNTITSINSVCPGSNFTLKIQNSLPFSGISYQWQSSPDSLAWSNISGSILDSLVRNQSQTTFYRCLTSCSGNSTPSKPIRISLWPTIPVLQGNLSGCGTVVLSTTPGFTYLWSGGQNPTSATNTLDTTGNYRLTVTYPGGCTSTRVISVNTNSPTLILTSSAGQTICQGTNTIFKVKVKNPGTGISYSWRKNGLAVGGNDSLFTDNSLANGDSVWCLVSSTYSGCGLIPKITQKLKMVVNSCNSVLQNGNAFLQDSHVEVAIGACGNFASSVNAPAGFHARGGDNYPNQLGFISNPKKDGWQTLVGDYFLPGTPEEGFGISIGTNDYNNNRICSVNQINGSVINVSSTSLEKSGTWQGNKNGLNITAKTYIPSGSLYFITKVTVTNTSASPINDIYYMRNVDPDQGKHLTSTNSFFTFNAVNFQNPNTCNRALVSAITKRVGGDYLGLGSVDPRAKVTYGGFDNRSARTIWSGSSSLIQSGSSDSLDIAISISFNVGTLNPNASTEFAYAYILSQSDLEQALAATNINPSISGVTASFGNVNDICQGTPIPITLSNTGTYNNWTWTPSTGLNQSTGTQVLATISEPTVYTATGSGPCGTVNLTVSLNPVIQPEPGNAGSISGPSNIDAAQNGVTYSITPVPNATSYIWRLPPGVIVTSTPNSNSITFNSSSSAWCGNISVRPINACGKGDSATLPVCINSPFSINLGSIQPTCPQGTQAILPYSSTTSSPTLYSIFWDPQALAAGFSNVINGSIPASPFIISRPSFLAIGQYKGFLTVGNGTLNSVSYPITVTVAKPDASIGIPPIICGSGLINAQISGGTSPFTYLWNTDSTRNTLSVSQSGLYSYIVTDASGCKDTASANIIVNPATPIPTISANGPLTFCAGGTVTLTSSALVGNKWNTGSTNRSITVSISGTYVDTVTVNGCKAVSSPVVVTVNPNPIKPVITGGPLTFCQGGSVQLTTNALGQHRWSTGATSSQITVSTTTTVLDTAILNGCKTISDPIQVTVNPNPVKPVISGGPLTFCEGGSVTLITSASGLHRWSNGSTAASIVVTSTSTIRDTAILGACKTVSDPVSIQVNPIPTKPTITPNGPLSFCQGGSVVLTASSPTGNKWSSGQTSQSITVIQSGSYVDTVTINGCKNNSDPVVVTVNPLPPIPTISPSGPITFCQGGSVTLTSSAPTGNRWSTGQTIQSIVVSNSQVVTDTVVINGCRSVSVPLVITVNPLPVSPIISSNGPTTFCLGGSVQLNTNASGFHRWSTGSTNSSILVSTTTLIRDTAILNGCKSVSNEIQVTVNPNPVKPAISASGPLTFCEGGSVTLFTSAPGSHRWSNGSTAASIVVTSTSTIRDTAILGACKTVSDPVSIQVNPIPAKPTISPNGPLSFCQGGSVVLTASSPTGNKWNSGQTSQSITVTQSGSFVDTVIINGCKNNSDPVVVTINPLPPIPTINPSGNTTFCQGGSVTLTSSAASGNRWSTGQTTQSIIVSTSQEITDTVVVNGCRSVSAPLVITVNPIPVKPIITPNGPLTFCQGGTVVLTSSYANGNRWNTGAFTQSIAINQTATIVDTVVINGCRSISDPILITVLSNPLPPTISVQGSNPFCEGDSVVLVSSYPGGNTWNTNQTSNSIAVKVSGEYSVTVGVSGCSSTSIPVVVTASPKPPKPTIVSSSGNAFCKGSTYTLFSDWQGTNKWSNGSFGNSINGNVAQTIVDTAILGQCKTPSDPFLITEKPLPLQPVVFVTNEQICPGGGTSTLTSSINNNIVWNTGQTTSSIQVDVPGEYFVTYTGANGCNINSGLAQISFAPDVQIRVLGNGVPAVCPGGQVQLTVDNAVSYKWSTGSRNQTITANPNTTTTYFVTATNDLECIYNKSITITVLSSTPPGAISNMVPANGQNNLQSPVTISWLPGLNNTHFDVFVWPQGSSRPANPTISNLTEITTNVGGLTNDVIYNWQVQPKSPCAAGPLSPIQTFRTTKLPDLSVSSVTLPTSSSVNSGEEIEVSWVTRNASNAGSSNNQVWFDKAYLSGDSLLSADDLAFGSVVRPVALNPGESYSLSSTLVLPNGISGSYYVIVVADRSNSLVEINEGNNFKVAANRLLVSLTPPPDLRITQLVPTPPILFSGFKYGIGWTTSNKGTGRTRSGFWYDKVYITQDSNLAINNSLLLITRKHEGNLNVDSSYSMMDSVEVPDDFSGRYWLFIVTDQTDREFEFSNNNNNRSLGIPIQIIESPRPDLLSFNISAPASASQSENIVISWFSRNQGLVFKGFYQDQIYLADTNLVGSSAYFIGSRSVSGNFKTDSVFQSSIQEPIQSPGPGSYYIMVKTDARDEVREGKGEKNNIAFSTTKITILAPDVQPQNIVLPDTIESDQPLDISYTLRNNGTGAVLSKQLNEQLELIPFAGGPTEASFSGQYPITLSNGNTFERQTQISLSPFTSGKFRVRVTANQPLGFSESNVLNNQSTSTGSVVIKLAKFADLKANLVQALTRARIDSSLTVKCKVTNVGQKATLTAWNDKLFISQSSVFNVSNATLIGNISRSLGLLPTESDSFAVQVTIPGYLNPGNYYLHFQTNSDGTLPELVNTNNLVSSTIFQIFPKPPVPPNPPGDPPVYNVDLMVQDVIAPANIVVNQPALLRWKVTNLGSTKTPDKAWNDVLYLSTNATWEPSDRKIKSWSSFGGLSTNGSYNRAEYFTIPNALGGSYYLFLVSDPDTISRDNNLINNRVTLIPPGGGGPIIITYPPAPDLQFQSVQVPSSGTVGQQLTLVYQIKNNGAGPANGSWVDAFYLTQSSNSDGILVKTKTQNRNLASGQSYSDTVQFVIPPGISGNYILLARTDQTNLVAESVEINNSTVTAITIATPLPADLIPTDISAPVSVAITKSLSVSWKLKNQGENPVNGLFSQAAYLSKDAFWDENDVLIGSLNQPVNLTPGSDQIYSLAGRIENVKDSLFYVVVKVDLEDMIPETNEWNNALASITQTSVTIPLLPIDVWQNDTLAPMKPIYYKLVVNQGLVNETALISILSLDTVGAVNELYVSKDRIPNRIQFDFRFENPLSASQRLFLPELKQGTYYIMAYSYGGVDQQRIQLQARIIPFSLETVQSRKGGNTGSVTLVITGARFEPGMKVELLGPATIPSASLTLASTTRGFVRFNLKDKPLGFYTLKITNKFNQTAQLVNVFEIEKGTTTITPLITSCSINGAVAYEVASPDDLEFSAFHPPSARPNETVKVVIAIRNTGNIDYPMPKRTIVSVGGAPVVLELSGLTSGQSQSSFQNLTLKEEGGPQDVLRAGATATATFFTKAIPTMQFSIQTN
jgi:hypothetical protein